MGTGRYRILLATVADPVKDLMYASLRSQGNYISTKIPKNKTKVVF